MIGTYKITNTDTGKYYYGSSKDVEVRLRRHKRELKQGIHHCAHLQRAYDKYGIEKFTFEVDQEFDVLKDARAHEQNILDTVEGLYNTSKFACGGDLISYHLKQDEIVGKIT